MDIDLARARLRVAQAGTEVDGRVGIGPPKTAAGVRWVSLPGSLLDPIVLHLAESVAVGPDSLVFAGQHGQVLRRRTIYAHWAKAEGVDCPHAVTMATRRAAVENLAAVMDRRLRIPLRNQALKSGSSS